MQTIIECLKYATTGELPPNSKTGGAFIHDPHLCGEKDVMAQVKLSFRSTSGIPMVVSRRMQLTVKKNSRAQKTLECSLQMKRDGQKETISSRVAELDQIMPQYLGVSKAVLENVIFCHQDDSLWPLSEPANLKKKFDAIFEAEKYTKAIENIKLIRKEKVSSLAAFQADERHAKEDKVRGEKSEKRQAQLYDEIAEEREQFDKVEAEANEAHRRATEAFDNAAKFQHVIAQLSGKRVQFQTHKENVESLEDNLKVMAETDEELESLLDKYQERVEYYSQQQDELKEEYLALQKELQQNRKSLGVKQGEVGKYEAEKDLHARNLQKRENIVKETAKCHGIRGFDYEVTEKQVIEFQQILAKLSREQNKSLERARKEAQDELGEAQAEVNRLSEQRSMMHQRKDMAKSQIATNDQRISNLQTAMIQIKADEGAEVILKERMEETEQQLRKANSEAANSGYDEKIQAAEKAVHSIDEQKERLEQELVDATQLASESAQIDYAQNKLKGTKHSLETMKKVHSSRISQLVDPEWEVATLESTFQQAISQKATQVKEAESRRDIAQSKLDTTNFKLSSVESEQKKLRAQLQKDEAIVLEASGKDDISDFEETLRELEEQYEIATSDQAKIEAQLDYMRSCLQTAREHNECRLCHRTLRDDPAEDFQRDAFISRLEKTVAKALKNAQAENADELFAELDAVRRAKPSYELATRTRDIELPRLQTEHEKLAAERDAINEQLEEHDIIISTLQSSKQEVESLSADVRSIVNYYNEARELESQISDLKEKQKAGGLSRGINAVREDLQKITEESRSAKANLSNLSSQREKSRKLINSLEIRVRDINAELNAAQASLKEKRDLTTRIEEFRSQNSEQREAMRGFDKEVQALVPQIEQAQLVYDDVNRRGNERVHRIQEEASKLSDSVRQLADAEQEIVAYIDKGGPLQLSRTVRDMENLEGEVHRIEQEMMRVTREVKQIEESLGQTDHMKQAIFDNLRYRRAKRALETLSEEIKALQAQNAENDQAHWNSEGERWIIEHHRLKAETVELTATMKQKDVQLKELIDEYKQEYKGAARKYREMHIKVETTKAACEDLARYGSALDKAIMKFHSLKMEEINQTIDELWRNAYQGTDVATIQIRSDNETGRGNRTYNYRVVMIKKDDTEMDMRGRCSAGQRVLASIVIRLALAECFGTNCGLIALDEPTTNLDQQNIKGLAESLSQIIQVRRKQANFQLLVITHDEHFLREMNCADYTDVYWRVNRDQHQQSYIERQNISEVSAFPFHR